MIDIQYIRSFFPPSIAGQQRFDRYMLKEYLQLMILDHISTTSYMSQLSFIGGTNLRLIHQIDRFSEDLDFDCKEMTENDFIDMTDSVVHYLHQNNIEVETRDKQNPKLKAFRRNLYFPQLLFNLGMTGHREEKFLIKIESQDQGISYVPEIKTINKMGFFFNLQVPPLSVLCSMKFTALLNRSKGRDFYDTIFLMSKTLPDFNFLEKKEGISNIEELKESVVNKLATVDLTLKQRDFEHLLYNPSNSQRILQFEDYIRKL